MTQQNHLSTKSISPCDRLIFALDVENNEQAKALVEVLGDSVSFYKLGLQLFMAGQCLELSQWLRDRGKKVFLDLKFFDVPQTVKLAVRASQQYGATFISVHGNDALLKAAVEAVASEKEEARTKILAVTVLTSLDRGDLDAMGFEVSVEKLVLSRAKRALELGCDGVISSGLEAPVLREEIGNNFVVLTPGIRPVDNSDDQKRTVNVEQAFNRGADYIVVGRPIKEHHGFSSPKAAAESIQSTIAKLF